MFHSSNIKLYMENTKSFSNLHIINRRTTRQVLNLESALSRWLNHYVKFNFAKLGNHYIYSNEGQRFVYAMISNITPSVEKCQKPTSVVCIPFGVISISIELDVLKVISPLNLTCVCMCVYSTCTMFIINQCSSTKMKEV